MKSVRFFINTNNNNILNKYVYVRINYYYFTVSCPVVFGIERVLSEIDSIDSQQLESG